MKINKRKPLTFTFALFTVLVLAACGSLEDRLKDALREGFNEALYGGAETTAETASGDNGNGSDTGSGNTNTPARVTTPSPGGVVNRRGNTAGNGMNGGLLAQQGDWIYYANAQLDDFRRVRMDGTDDQQIMKGNAVEINVLGNYIFVRRFLGHSGHTLSHVYFDPDDPERWFDLILDNVVFISVVGEWIYYIDIGDDYAIYKLWADMETPYNFDFQWSERGQKLNDEVSSYMTVDDDWIYYVSGFGGGGDLRKMRTDGTENQILYESEHYGIYHPIAKDGWIYFLDRYIPYYLCKIRPDGTDKQILADDASVHFNVSGDRIFYLSDAEYTAYDGELYNMRTDGTDKRKLTDEVTKERGIYLTGDWVHFYRSYEWNSYTHYMVCKDGTGLQLFEDFIR
jgi:hypothetical protein